VDWSLDLLQMLNYRFLFPSSPEHADFLVRVTRVSMELFIFRLHFIGIFFMLFAPGNIGPSVHHAALRPTRTSAFAVRTLPLCRSGAFPLHIRTLCMRSSCQSESFWMAEEFTSYRMICNIKQFFRNASPLLVEPNGHLIHDCSRLSCLGLHAYKSLLD
jgi:hypothetical protein